MKEFIAWIKGAGFRSLWYLVGAIGGQLLLGNWFITGILTGVFLTDNWVTIKNIAAELKTKTQN